MTMTDATPPATLRSKRNVLDMYPLTPLQKGILFHAVGAERNDPYLVRMCFRLAGAIDPVALHQAWQAVVDRHEALRADIEWVKTKEPIQIVYRQCPVALDTLAWDGVPPAELPARLHALLDDEASRFALHRAADRRIVLVRTAPAQFLLVWVFHHVLLDGWSVGNILAEVLAVYRARTTGTAAELAAVPPYTRYLEWLKSRDTAEAEAYFRAALAGFDAPPEFPPPPRAPASDGYAERSLVLDPAASTRLRDFARHAQVTLNTVFQGALALLISAYTASDDVVFGATVAGRPPELAGADAMVGAFINTVPVRVAIRGSDAAVPWLQGLHRENGRRRAFEHLGLPRVQELAPIARGRALFEAILVFENFPVSAALEEAHTHGLHIDVEAAGHTGDDGILSGRGRNNYPVTFVVLPGERIEVILAYHRGRVDDAAAAAMLACMDALVDALISTLGASPQACLAAVLDRSVVGPAEAATPAAEPAAPGAIHDLIARWTGATPDAIALRCDDLVLSYAELERSANWLARILVEQGVVAGARVGVGLPRSADFIVALYAILKCGAAYVPLDTEQPRARLTSLIDDAQLHAVVTGTPLVARLTGDDGPPVILVDGLIASAIASAGDRTADRAAIHARVHPESPAYIIYTSGSTGIPKGVVVSHRALHNYVTGLGERLALPAATSMAMVSTVAADLGHTVLFGALCSGGALHLLSDARTTDPDGFADYMARHRIGVLKIVPSHLWGLMQTAAPERALPSHTLVIGGEAAPRELLERLQRTRCRVVNHYGPTETTVGVLTSEVFGDGPVDERSEALGSGDPAGSAGGAGSKAARGIDFPVPLGRPLPRSRVHILGPDLRAMPAGATGEIFIGGAGLAAGYLRRPALTAERFIPDPTPGAAPGARLYRTGDRGRRRSDGAIEFLGRTDDQVKLRGHRIELGEIKAALCRHAGVADARVVLRAGAAGTPRLVAYLVGTGSAADTAALDAQLRGRLPEPMVPSDYVWLDRFPVTANGKIDVARLPEPAAQRATAARPPTTEREQALAAIWREVLGHPEVGADDDFFQLGGDSILALKVVARARKAGLKLTPKQLYAHPTIARAALVATPLAAEPARPTTRATGDVQLTPIQRAFLARQTLDVHHFNQAILLTVTGPDERSEASSVGDLAGAGGGSPRGIDLALLARAVDIVTQHHDALRLRFRPDAQASGAWRQWLTDQPPTGTFSRVALPAIGSAEEADQTLGAETPEAASEAIIERACDALQRGFDLERGPLFRAAYLDRGNPRDSRLLLVAHHLVVDGVSWRILLEDLAEAYLALAAGRAAELPPRTTSFQRWTELLHAHSRRPALLIELAYWREAIRPPAGLPATRAAEPPAANLVGDRGATAPPHATTSITANVVGDVAIATAELDDADTAALLSRAPAAYRTEVNDLLLAALALSLCRAQATDSVLIQLEGHGREELDDPAGAPAGASDAPGAAARHATGHEASSAPDRSRSAPAGGAGGPQRTEAGRPPEHEAGVDLSRTVGWFSTVYPVRLTPVPGDPAATLRTVRDHLRRIPRKGLGHGILAQLGPDDVRQALTAPGTAVPDVTFNYLGQFDQAFDHHKLFRVAPESSGQRRSPASPRDTAFVVNAIVHEGALRIDWEYSRALHSRAVAEQLLAAYVADLRALIHHCITVLAP